MPKKKPPPTSGSASLAPGFQDLLQIQFHLVSRLSLRQSEKDIWQEFGLLLREARIIGVVGSSGSLPFRHLTTRDHFEKGHASRLVAALVRKGLLRNEINPEDQRSNFLRLTPKGQELYERLLVTARKRNQRWLAVLSREQHEALRQALAALTKLLSETEETDNSTKPVAARRPRAVRPAQAPGAP